MSKKVLIFSLAYYPHVGGAEVAIKEITDRIRPDDIEFHMITLHFASHDRREEQIGNVHVHRVGFGSAYLSKIFFIPLAVFAAKRLHRIHRFDGLWAMMSYMVLPIVLLRLMGTKLPYALTVQEGDPFARVFRRAFIRPFLPLLRSGFRTARVIQVISHHLAEWPKQFGYKGPIEVIPNGADIAHFSAEVSPAEVKKVEENMGKQDGDVFLITTSRLIHKNGLDNVIRALPLLPPHIKFLVLGIGTEEENLKELAKKLSVNARVQFAGYVAHATMPAYLHASDIFIRPSRSEGMGNSFIEAMAAGVPVIATQEGGIADFLFDAKKNPDKPTTGWAVAVNNPQDIARAVQDIVGNPEEVKRVIGNARDLAVEKYDWDHITTLMREKVFSTMR